MDWKKLGKFRNLNRFDVWQVVFQYLDIKSVVNGLAKSCKSFKKLCLMNLSHIKKICVLSISVENNSSITNLVELLKCEKTFLLKISSGFKIPLAFPSSFANNSVIRFKYKCKNGNFSLVGPVASILTNLNHFTLTGNSQLPILPEKYSEKLFSELSQKKINYLKISEITLTKSGFKSVKKYLKEKTPMVVVLDFNCFYEKASHFQDHLAELWKKKWLLNIDYKLNGKVLFSCTREFLAY